MSTFTTHFQIVKPDFLESPWHDELLAGFDKIDKICYALLKLEGGDIYALNHVYVAGNPAFDTSNDTLYICLVGHTSHAANSFATERAAHPTFWLAVV